MALFMDTMTHDDDDGDGQCTGSWGWQSKDGWRSKADPKTPQVGPRKGPNGAQFGRPKGLHVDQKCKTKSSRPRKLEPL